ncbi:UNKNOWN [Stylonychia lemnae]|uniref:TLDc domain-containing protein n=1 Tax=Stylonychia lemnae TaxID=5949 RepID=A0A077ZU80_STYLE|nr:UNKNOWN [Stylonychia lemnae]|eukprot:CDW73134.1 UNKNOWN [Stylonychia lemnae]
MDFLICKSCQLTYNISNRKPIIQLCDAQNHQSRDHSLVKKSMFENYLQQVIPELQDAIQRIQDILEILLNLSSGDKVFNSDYIMDKCSTAHNLIIRTIEKERFNLSLIEKCDLNMYLTKKQNSNYKLDDQIFQQSSKNPQEQNEQPKNQEVKLRKRDTKQQIKQKQKELAIQKEIAQMYTSNNNAQEIQKIEDRFSDKYYEFSQIKPVQCSLQSKIHKNESKLLHFQKLVEKEIQTGGFLWNNCFKQNSKYQCELLFRGSRDGFRGENLREKCKNESKTLSFILSEQGFVFGGFVTSDWQQGIVKIGPGSNSFIFSLTHNSIHPRLKKDWEVYWTVDLIWKQFNDLVIVDNCNVNQDSIAELGAHYDDTSMKQGLNLTNHQYLAGKDRFKVLEIEVFKVLDSSKDNSMVQQFKIQIKK